MNDAIFTRMRLAGWSPLSEIENWPTIPRLRLYHPKWGILEHVHPRDRFGIDPDTVWGFVPE